MIIEVETIAVRNDGGKIQNDFINVRKSTLLWRENKNPKPKTISKKI